MSVSVCPHVPVYLKITSPKFTNISVHNIRGRGSVLLWKRRDTSCISGFVNDVMFAHNAGAEATREGERFSTSSADSAVRHATNSAYAQNKSRAAATGAEFNVRDCFV